MQVPYPACGPEQGKKEGNGARREVSGPRSGRRCDRRSCGSARGGRASGRGGRSGSRARRRSGGARRRRSGAGGRPPAGRTRRLTAGARPSDERGGDERDTATSRRKERVDIAAPPSGVRVADRRGRRPAGLVVRCAPCAGSPSFVGVRRSGSWPRSSWETRSGPAPALPRRRARRAAPLDRAALAERLARAVRIETVSRGDGRAPGSRRPPRAPRAPRARLPPTARGARARRSWPRARSSTAGPARDAGLAPILLMGHLDVVPVEPGTEARWTHPPFSGAGRRRASSGAAAPSTTRCRCSASPRRRSSCSARASRRAARSTSRSATTRRSAATSAPRPSRGPSPSAACRLAFTLDEGMGIVERGLVPGLDGDVALSASPRRATVSLELVANAPGGHSSTPPRDTAVGRLARALARVEAHPQPEAIRGPVAAMFDSLAPATSSFGIRLALRNRWLFDPAIRAALRREPAQAALLHTTTAPTVLRAGVKDNVLPSEAHAVREPPGAARRHRRRRRRARARAPIDDPAVELRVLEGREPSPTADPGSRELRASSRRTIREIFPGHGGGARPRPRRHRQQALRRVAEQSFRFVPLRLAPEDLKRIHGTDERIAIDNYLDVVRFFVRPDRERSRGRGSTNPLSPPRGLLASRARTSRRSRRSTRMLATASAGSVGNGGALAHGGDERAQLVRVAARRRARARRGGPRALRTVEAVPDLRRDRVHDAQLAGVADRRARSRPAASPRRASTRCARCGRRGSGARPPSSGRPAASESRASARSDLGLRAREGAHDVDRVAARVHGGAAREVEAVADVAGQERAARRSAPRRGARRRARRAAITSRMRSASGW